MALRHFAIQGEVSGEVYRTLIEASLGYCSRGLLVRRHSVPFSERAVKAINQLSPYLVEQEERAEWPGTKLSGHSALDFVFVLNRDSANVLLSSATGLYEWQQPDLPEDLCLVRGDSRPWLVTIAHERDAYLDLSDLEARDLLTKVPRLDLS
jgi:hypothetical protein